MKKTTIVSRLILTLSAVIFLAMASGVLAWWMDRGVQKREAESFRWQVRLLVSVQEMQTGILLLHDAVRGVLLDAGSQSEKEQINQAEEMLASATRRAERLAQGEALLKLREWARYDEEVFRALERQVVSISATNLPAAKLMYVEQYLPARAKQDASIERLLSVVAAETEAGMQHSGEVAWVVVVILVVILLVCSGAAKLLVSSINRPLAQLRTAMERLRQGDFSQRLHLEVQDEFGELAEGLNRVTDDLARLVGQVQRSVITVNTSVTEIAATSKEQQATTSEIAATTTEIGATSKEISATSKELVKTMQEVADVAEESARLAGSGQEGLSRMEETMRHVMEASAAINGKLAVLNEKAGNINQVVVTITKVADQTNLLSLNAAIEAEKAGEYGRGFAVVATEIRRLADQTAVATFDIEQMVKEIQSAVAAGVMGMDKFSEEVRRGLQEIEKVGGQLSQIISQVQNLAPRMEAVNEGTQAQATGAEQITQALTQLSDAAQQTAESLRQSTAAIVELNDAVTGLRNGVSTFKLES